MRSDRIVLKYILVITFVFLILLLGRLYYDYLHQKDMIEEKELSINEEIQRSFQDSKDNLIKAYKILSTHLMNSKVINDYLKNDKREELHELLKKDYEDLKKVDPNLFVMHFIDKNNTTILRMHKPFSFDDDLSRKRPIVAYANRALKPQYAFEVGKNGIVYRITTPFIYKGEHTGLLEFGIKLKYFSQSIDSRYDTFSAILVKNDALKVLSAKKNYPKIDDYSIVEEDNIFHKLKKDIDLSKSSQLIESNGRSYLLFNDINLEDYTGKAVSKILVAKDITSMVEKYDRWLTFINTLSFVIFLLIIFVLYVVLSKFEIEIKHYLKTISALNKKSANLKNKANSDHLTNIFNKRYFNKYLRGFIKKNRQGCILFFDIDHFKKINDTYGHLAGDEILKELANIIKSHLRQEDVFVRWGGEEFIILFENILLDEAAKKAEEIRALVVKTKLYKNIDVTISIGVVEIEQESSKKEILGKADQMLYKAKESGRNCIKC